MDPRWLLLLLVPLALPADAHGGEHVCDDVRAGLNHLRVWNGTLAPGESATQTAVFEQCPLRADWWVFLWLEGDDGLAVEVDHEGTGFGPWDFSQRYRHFQLPASGFPEITVRNEAAHNASFRLYFDQTCECTSKGIFVPEGAVWFNAPAQADEVVAWDFSIVPVWTELAGQPEPPEHITLRMAQVVPGEDGLQPVWEHAVTFEPRSDRSCADGGPFMGCEHFEFPARGDGMQYVWVEMEHDGDPRWALQVRPELDVRQQAPGLAILPVALVMVALAVWRR